MIKLNFKPILGTLAVALLLTGVIGLAAMQAPPQQANAAGTSEKDPTPPDPNRPYYDQWGNKYQYDGVLLDAACPNVPDSTSGQDNPKCVCPAPNAKGAYHVRGYDKDTNAVVCGFTYYNECPYFAGAEAGTPECEKGKPTPEQLQPWDPNQSKEPTTCTGK